MKPKSIQSSNDSKQLWAWCMYDWANSAFATSVLAAFFPVFFKTFWHAGVNAPQSTAHLGITTAIAGGLIALIAIPIGILADLSGIKVRLLGIFALLGMCATACLYWVPQGGYFWAAVLFICADIGFSCSLIFYDSLLPHLSPASRLDTNSSKGYAYGYLGGGILLIINVLMVLHPAWFHIASTQMAIKLCFISVALWWFAFSVPILLFVKEPESVSHTGLLRTHIQRGMVELRSSLSNCFSRPVLVYFLIGYWLYIDGVFTFIRMAIDFGMSIGLKSSSLILALIIVQVVAFPAAILGGKLSKRRGCSRIIVGALLIYCLLAGFGPWLLHSTTLFYIFAAAVGMIQGVVQALSRSYFCTMIPKEESSGYFGIYNMIGKCSVVLGPLSVGGVAMFGQYVGLSDTNASRLGMSSITIFFIAGLALFLTSKQLHKKLTKV